MFNSTIRRIFVTAASLLKQRRILGAFALLYALLLGAVYGLVFTPEATVGQVLVTLALILATPFLFFLLQAAILDNARHGKLDPRRVIRSGFKLFAVTLPVILVAAGAFLLLNQWQSHYPAPIPPPWLRAEGLAPEPLRQDIHWPTLMFSTLRWIVFGVLVPLFIIHLWIATTNPRRETRVRKSFSFIKRIRQIFVRAFAPASVFTYTIGMLVVVVVPYALLFVHIPINGARTDFAVFIVRLIFVFMVTLFGWLITITSLALDSFDLQDQLEDERDALTSLEEHSSDSVSNYFAHAARVRQRL
jgi:hypothetical protein